jgi:1,4-dihydroxy-2-naphthoate octaprenyltransferase
MVNFTASHNKILAFLKLTRGIFLLGGIILYNLGVTIALSNGYAIDARKYWIGQLIVTLIQLTAQLANEYFDIEVDRINTRNRTWFSGGSGILPSEEISKDSIRLVCVFLTIIILVLITVISPSSPLMACLALISLAGSLFYSAPPLSLMSSGFGELTTSVIVSLFVPISGYLIQTNTINTMMVQALLPLFFLHYAMLVAFEFPDWASDRQVGKKTVCVRLGRRATSVLHGLFILVGMFLYFYFSGLTLRNIGSSFFIILLSFCQILIVPLSIRHPSTRLYHLLTACAIALFSSLAVLTLARNIPG